ncbi:zinc finger protein 407-like [Oppia nitens]|uniref:zinc finger protein 407-like n=1 Tax=Oppia nitens TaxID=1686743 RepID=UPI0023D998FD|nr:zinc finger protein 407-like [Oppia nitens]
MTITANYSVLDKFKRRMESHPQHQSSGETIYIQVQSTNDFDTQNTDLETAVQQLQQQVHEEQQQRVQLEQELQVLREKNTELENKLRQQQTLSSQAKGLHENQLKRLKQELVKGDVTEQGTTRKRTITKISEPAHTCDECAFDTKSEVSIILHKMNHGITQKQFVLSTTCFTTRNTNSKNTYSCPACDDAPRLTRHEVYRHIYEIHTNEKPQKCPNCEYSFTHADYLSEHQKEKHADELLASNNKKPRMTTITPNANRSAVVVVSSSNGAMNTETALAVSSITGIKTETGADMIGTPYTPVRGRRPIITPQNIEFKCTFPDCGFVTNSQEKLDFHVKAHTNTKYKCPYCPYVSNTIVDIKRHIQKSKKHEGQKVYACQQCGYGSDCDRTFKDHLRNYHFGLEAPENMMDYFIEEMFSNKNKRQQAEA